MKINFSVIANPDREAIYYPLSLLDKWATEKGLNVFISADVYDQVKKPGKSLRRVGSEHEAVFESDVVVAIGGDGTMLRVASLALNSRKRILGVNSGRMGFLANIQQKDFIEALDYVLAGNYELDQRFMLQAEINEGEPVYALNEFLFTKKGSASMITLTVEYDGIFVNKYWADGILISTPTGSTAYNLSSGGPIVFPETDVLIVTPINPHTLTTRPLVIPADKKITVKVTPEDQEVLFSNDGENTETNGRITVVDVHRTDFTIDVIQLPGQTYFQTLRSKLMWGVDVREKS